ncbi:tRNA glutamyl-Q(34) synthetase GluQRS [Oceanicoccus sp. KOV_DT_Chl]|uniref:tRNA glutamyl-Q(34) synthetase GluQRS n=1 Tax=Oceanicoccus sp. KOV_DT_Chl TaxID=1904639 RepID=UPI001F38DACC|nr:tRNA glutamyl-Q(34) synthetase GluQRS [Oceanicoccus sp. KOV_DT_Chl]
MTKPEPPPYIGRFAPSPTGLLHIGSLIGAVASYVDAKAHQGKWLVRIEDLDPPREITGAADAILHSLEQHGLHWDDSVMWQSQRHQAYQHTIEQLQSSNHIFYCSCSRSNLKANKGIYPGRCRHQQHPPKNAAAIRLVVPDQSIGFDDAIQGYYAQQLKQEVGDFVLQRKDGLFAYQLAVVVDDQQQQISHIVRGSDLLDSTPDKSGCNKYWGLTPPSMPTFPLSPINRGKSSANKPLPNR